MTTERVGREVFPSERISLEIGPPSLSAWAIEQHMKVFSVLMIPLLFMDPR